MTLIFKLVSCGPCRTGAGSLLRVNLCCVFTEDADLLAGLVRVLQNGYIPCVEHVHGPAGGRSMDFLCLRVNLFCAPGGMGGMIAMSARQCGMAGGGWDGFDHYFAQAVWDGWGWAG